jgi:hypothetical protein
MLNHEAQAAAVQHAIIAVSAANTAAATSAWLDVRGMEGDIEVIVSVGAVTGTLVLTTEDANTSGGGASAGITPTEGAFAAATANTLHKRTIDAKAHRGWIRVVGTIGTGPSLIAAVVQARPKNF